MKKITRNRWFYLCELLIDTFVVLASYYTGFRIQRPGLFGEAFLPPSVANQLLLVGIISLVLFVAFKTYKCGKKDLSTTMLYIFVIIIIIPVVAVFLDLAFKSIGFWRRTMFYASIIEIIAFPIIKYLFYKLHKRIIKPIGSIIIGTDREDMLKLLKSFTHKSNTSYYINYLVSYKSNDLYEYIKNTRQVIISSKCNSAVTSEIVEYCTVNNIDCMIVPTYNNIIINGGKFLSIDDTMMFSMDIKMDMEMRVIKRTMDIVISSLGILILSPIMLIAALLIKIQDGGRIIYAQERVTINNRIFTLYKFRTMIENAEDETGAVLAKASDIRITKIGKFMRLFRIDEIPQLFNVLKGDMSFVGPRPERMEFVEKIIAKTPEFRYRTLVKAGLTGLAQSMGKYDTDFDRKILFDLYYVTNYSILLDLKIIFYTFKTLLTPSIAIGVDEQNDISSYFSDLGYSLTDVEENIQITMTK